MRSKALSCLLLLFLIIATPPAETHAQDDILSFMPAILSAASVNKVSLEVTASESGSISSTCGISYNYTTGRGRLSTTYAQSGTRSAALTATPEAGASVDYWRGCDSVSADGTVCTVSKSADRLVQVVFSQNTTELRAEVVDLTGATVSIAGDEYTVTYDPTDTVMAAAVGGLSAGDYIVSAGTPSFLRQVDAIEQLGSTTFSLATSFAALEDVIKSGTGSVSKQMTQGDLTGEASNPLVSSTMGTNYVGYVVRSDDPASKTFRVVIGEPHAGMEYIDADDVTTGYSLIFKDGNGNSVTVRGVIDTRDRQCGNGRRGQRKAPVVLLRLHQQALRGELSGVDA